MKLKQANIQFLVSVYPTNRTIVFIFFYQQGDTIILPCHLDNDDQNAGDLYWIKSETGSPNGRILTQGNIIMDYDLEDRIDEDELELNSEINGKDFKTINYYLGRF